LAGINSYNSVSTGTMNIPPPMPVNEATMAMRKPKIGSSHKSSISWSLMQSWCLRDLFREELQDICQTVKTENLEETTIKDKEFLRFFNSTDYEDFPQMQGN